jgi:mannosylglucosylglycerate synthase
VRAMPTACLLSFRLGGGDGVSVEAAKWAGALKVLGWQVYTVAGSGTVDSVLPGLAMDAPDPPTPAEVRDALAPADLVVVENVCSLPLNPAAAAAVASACAGRPALLHHHDLPWQRARFAGFPPPPDDPAWAHVTINARSQQELATQGITATTVYNTFDPDPPPGRQAATRAALGVADRTHLLLQPTRALPRKNIEGGLALAEGVGGTYWLLGPAEDGYGPELNRLVRAARCPVILGPGPGLRDGGLTVADAYAACDAVLLPSTWEGFGNPAVESATHRRALAIGSYPVAAELAAFGFRWFPADDPGPLGGWLSAPDEALLRHNHEVAARHFNVADLPGRLEGVLARLSSLPT